MKMRKSFHPSDARIILSWIKDEKTQRMWGVDKFSHFPLSEDDLKTYYSDYFADENSYVFSFYDDDTPVGSLCAKLDEETKTVRLSRIIVDDTKRSRGYATSMLVHAISFFFEKKHQKRITLGVYENNLPALRCYSKLGFYRYEDKEYTFFGEKWNFTQMMISADDYCGFIAGHSAEHISYRLSLLQDKEYKSFISSLLPTVNDDTIIGVRTPALRSFAKEIFGTEAAKKYLSILPHTYYEENLLHAFLIEREKNYEECISSLSAFLPHVDNWACCDSLSPPVFKKHPDELLNEVKIWLSSKEPYTVRFGIKTLMNFYLDENFKTEYLDLVASIKSEHYYVNMMIAWFFATALAKQYDSALPYIEKHLLDAPVHNQAINKCVDSRRISPDQKEHLKALKLKNTKRLSLCDNYK
jgi:RimJ/RimL family protein N-acetyltransferase/3-methyladenine DNA glycosylase AlkD